MDIETAANPAGEGPVTLADAVETANAATDATQQEANTQAGGDSDPLDDLTKEALGTPPEGDAEPVEVEYEGKTFKVDPVLKDALLRQSDYTRKTMTLAEERKAVQQQRTELAERAKLNGEEARVSLRHDAIAAEIVELSQMSTAGMTQEQVNQATEYLRGLQAEQARLGGALSQFRQQREARSSEQFAKLRDACLKETSAKVPNFTDERREALEKFAVDLGVDPAEAKSIVSPAGYEILHYADIGKKFIERQRNAANIKAAGQGTPAKTVGASASGAKSPEDMSFEEFAKWREAGNG